MPRLLGHLSQYTLVCNSNDPRLGGERAEIFFHPLQVTRSIVSAADPVGAAPAEPLSDPGADRSGAGCWGGVTVVVVVVVVIFIAANIGWILLALCLLGGAMSQ